MAYADYEFYATSFGGSLIDEKGFPGLSARASAYIDYVTIGRAKNASGDVLEAVKMACCALAEVFQDEGRMNATAFSSTGTLSSETVGDFTKVYKSYDMSSTDVALIESRKKDAVLMFLAGTSLLSPAGVPVARRG